MVRQSSDSNSDWSGNGLAICSSHGVYAGALPCQGCFASLRDGALDREPLRPRWAVMSRWPRTEHVNVTPFGLGSRVTTAGNPVTVRPEQRYMQPRNPCYSTVVFSSRILNPPTMCHPAFGRMTRLFAFNNVDHTCFGGFRVTRRRSSTRS